VTARGLIVLLGIGLGACSAPPPARHELYVLHTLVTVTLPDDADGAQLALVERTLRAAEARYTAWGEGELARANAALARGEPATVSRELAAALQDARALSVASGGRFDPGVGRLVEAWGFHRDDRADGPPPDATWLAAWRADPPRIHALTIDGATLSSARRDLWLDLGAWAKGRAVDEALTALRTAGARSALLAAAGDICALGDKHGAPWRVGIRDPRGAGVLTTITLADGECISTSGDYERGFGWAGARYHHLLDPATGEPARGLASVSVIARHGAHADAIATAAFVAGPEAALATAAMLGSPAALLVTSSGEQRASPTLAARATPP
jgi:thiamine biosynthesis lipoprotein